MFYWFSLLKLISSFKEKTTFQERVFCQVRLVGVWEQSVVGGEEWEENHSQEVCGGEIPSGQFITRSVSLHRVRCWCP